MTKAALYFLMTKSLWLIADYSLMMCCEKWIELLTGQPASIIVGMLIYYGAIYAISFLIDKMVWLVKYPLLLCSPLVITSIVITCLWMYTGEVQVWWMYTLMAMISFLYVVTSTCAATLMDNRVMAKKKPTLLSVNDFLAGIIGTLLFCVGGFFLSTVQHMQPFLVIAVVGYGLAYYFLYALSKQSVIQVDKDVDQQLPSMKLIYIIPLILFALFFTSQLFYASIDPLHTVYVAEVIGKGQETTFRFIACTYLGGLLVSLCVPIILKRLTLLHIYLVLFVLLGTYYAMLTFNTPLLVIYGMLVIVGACSHLLSTAMMIYLHHHYSDDLLGRYILLYQQGESVGPCISFLIVAVLTGLLSLSFHIIMTLFILAITVPILSMLLLHFPLSRMKKA